MKKCGSWYSNQQRPHHMTHEKGCNSAKGITWSCRANTNYSLSIPDLPFIVSHHAYPDIPATTIARSQRECQDNRTQVQFQRRYSCCCHLENHTRISQP